MTSQPELNRVELQSQLEQTQTQKQKLKSSSRSSRSSSNESRTSAPVAVGIRWSCGAVVLAVRATQVESSHVEKSAQ
ncbi:hypothetical protein AWZ03_003106 [Drosophila navojoa]|uniref:Uncharacterized protein n=1 Tax=Drosophila navojoa TaxID=7232 RepID=A0A484BP18_DRONA|nr:hypothetical protein AWZ03_003106 [Drosophila navojoa]